MLQRKAGYIDARPLAANSTKFSCNARPDHTLGSIASFLTPSDQVGSAASRRPTERARPAADRDILAPLERAWGVERCIRSAWAASNCNCRANLRSWTAGSKRHAPAVRTRPPWRGSLSVWRTRKSQCPDSAQRRTRLLRFKRGHSQIQNGPATTERASSVLSELGHSKGT
jgi:hypothetical protein